jgi:hypothetical protein
VLVLRVRIKHSRLTHEYLMGVEPVRHVFFECDGYKAHSWSLNMGRDLRSTLAESVENTWKVIDFF